MLETPVLFLVFNRLDLTQQSFAKIRAVQPTQLYIAADGARPHHATDAAQCAATRQYILDNIDWECAVYVLFRAENLGCAEAVSGALAWFFGAVEQGIIIEDDCVANPSFFYFCEKMLHYHKNNAQVWCINGTNFQRSWRRGSASYYYSQYAAVWGWATWRRSWQHYDFEIKNLPEFIQKNTIATVFKNEKIQQDWIKKLQALYDHKPDTWYYQWFLAQWQQKSFAVVPQVNLVSNIGFDTRGAHTTNPRSTKSKMQIYSIDYKHIKHPKSIAVHAQADLYFYTQGNKIEHFLRRIYYRLQLILGIKKLPPAKL
jgi:hypothetical protein